VTFTVRDGVDVPNDSTAAVRWRNLLGQRYLYVYPGEAEKALEPGERIGKTRAVVDLGELFNRLGPIVKEIDPAQVNTFLDAVVGALDGNEEKIRQALDDLARFAGALGDRDAAIARLVTNLDTVAGTITARDREIRTVLDNLLAITATFNDNTNVLDSAVTELDRFSTNFGTLLEDNRAHIDNILNNLTVVVEVVRSKLPQLDATLGNVDELSVALFNASRYGEWLNQTIYCGAVGRLPSGEALTTTDCALPVVGGQLPSSSGGSALGPLITGAVG
jgi:phospholipid/cholesterol/gamma-HCH transport system substrate-binding protein